MNSRDIEGLILALKEAVRSDNEIQGLGISVSLLSGALTDLNRCADALEAIAKDMEGRA